MNCYRHLGIEAVGVCAECGRGICRTDQVIMDGKRFCRPDAGRRLAGEQHDAAMHRRGWALTLASVLAVVDGLAGVVVGFLLIILGMFGAPNQLPSFLSTTVEPFLTYFADVLQFPPFTTLLVGAFVTTLGLFDVIAGYYLWARYKAAAIIAVIVSILGGDTVGIYLEVIALAGPFVFVWIASAALKVASIGLGWRHLRQNHPSESRPLQVSMANRVPVGTPRMEPEGRHRPSD